MNGPSRRAAAWIGAVLLQIGARALPADSDLRVKVTPREIDDLFPNPGMGWQTFHHFADEDREPRRAPERRRLLPLLLGEIEPVEGRDRLRQARRGSSPTPRRRGRSSPSAIMCTGTPTAPPCTCPRG